LIKEETCTFFVYEEEKKKNVLAKTLNGAIYLTTNASGTGTNGLDFLPLFDEIFLRQLIESVR